MADLNDIVGGWSLAAAKFELSDGSTEDMYGATREARFSSLLIVA